MLSDTMKMNGFILTLTELTANIFACVMSLIILIILIYNISTKKIKREDRMGIKLCAHIYFSILIYSSLLISTNIQTILGDTYGTSFNTLSCIVSGYLALIFLYILYMTFINQAFYRLIRIVYFHQRWIENYSLQVILVIIEIIICCILLSPEVKWNGVIYLKSDYFCYASFSNILGIFWAAAVVYIVPFLILLSIYIFITSYLREQRSNITVAMGLRQNRDFIVIQRTLVIVCLLLVLGIPAMSTIAYVVVVGEELPLTIRIAFLPVSISVSSLTVALILTIPQLKTMARKLFRSIQIRPSIVTQQNGNTTGM